MTDAPDTGRAKNTETQDAAAQKLLLELGDKVVQAQYNGVAPAFQNNGKPGKGRDSDYIGPLDPNKNKGTYGPSGTLVPGGGGQPEQVPDFKKIHQDQQVDPNKPWSTNTDYGQPGRPGSGPRRQFAWEGGDFFDKRVTQTIDNRGQHHDLLNASIFAAGVALPMPFVHRSISGAADRAVENGIKNGTEDAFGSRMGKWWQTNVDPTKANAADLIKNNPKVADGYTQFDALKTTLKTASEGEGEAAALAKSKLEFLEARANKFDAGNVMEARSLSGGKAFSEAEVAILQNRATSGAAVNSAETKVAGRLASMVENSPGWLQRIGSGIIGTVGTYGAVSMDRGMTAKIGGAEALHQSWNASQFLAPMALAAMPGKYKLAAPFLAVAGSQAIDGIARVTGLTAPDRFNAASGVFDGWNGGFLAGSLSLAAYAKNPTAKAIIAGIGTLGPLAVHAYQDNIGGNLKGKTDDVRSSIQDDHSERSLSSLHDVGKAVDKVLNKKEDWIIANVDASFAAMSDAKIWPTLSDEKKLLALRDDAGTTGALADSLLTKGTRLSDKSDNSTYMLDGYDLDMGGRSLYYMMRSRNSAEKAATLTEGIIDWNKNNPGKEVSVKGELPSSKEVDDLRKFSAEKQPEITKILDGKHDIRGAFDEMVKNAKVIDKAWLQTYIRNPDNLILEYLKKGAATQKAAEQAAADGNEALRAAAQAKTDEYAKVVGKIYRDQALAYMAVAAAKMKDGNDGGGAYDLLVDDGPSRKDIFQGNARYPSQAKSYSGAQGSLRMAENYSPDNVDMKELGEIYSELVTQMQEKKKLQLDGNSKTNILGYHDNFRRPGGN